MKLVIHIEDEKSVAQAVEQVLGLLDDGYTSGYRPRWFLSEDGTDPMEPSAVDCPRSPVEDAR